MATIGIKKAAWDGARDNQRAILRWGVKRLSLGQPATFTDTSGAEWFIFDDRRIDLRQIALLGTLVAGLAALPASWKPPTNADGSVDREATEVLVTDYVKAKFVAPTDITYTEIVDVEVPIYEWQTRTYVDEFTGETVEYEARVDTGQTKTIQEERALPNPWQVTLDAQGAPAAIAAAGHVPVSWKAVT